MQAPLKDRVKKVGDAVVDLIPESHSRGERGVPALRNTAATLRSQASGLVAKARSRT